MKRKQCVAFFFLVSSEFYVCFWRSCKKKREWILMLIMWNTCLFAVSVRVLHYYSIKHSIKTHCLFLNFFIWRREKNVSNIVSHCYLSFSFSTFDAAIFHKTWRKNDDNFRGYSNLRLFFICSFVYSVYKWLIYLFWSHKLCWDIFHFVDLFLLVFSHPK